MAMSHSGALLGWLGDSEYLPRAGDNGGMQASCCLSPTLVLGPGDQVPGEFRMRPTLSPDKGTGAQHRQVLSRPPEQRARVAYYRVNRWDSSAQIQKKQTDRQHPLTTQT
ncbi:MAG TPA: hypothetical protein DEO64_11170 [Alcaligenes faecalis]|nr:hypothetical protein [Alcaligenes faecalis]